MRPFDGFAVAFALATVTAVGISAAGSTQPSKALLGESAPPVSALTGDGPQWHLADERGKRIVMMLTEQAAPERAEIASGLRRHNTGLVIVRTDAGARPESGDNWRTVTGAGAGQLEPYTGARSGGPAAFLIDESGVLRARLHGRDANPGAVAALPARWEAGKRLYYISCSRCHGDSGNDDSYPNAGKLGGIGNRHTVEEVLRLTLATGVVDLGRVSEEDKLNLALYVAGLSADQSGE
jgi:mono/diheme cytochrome c family protein